VRDNLYAKLAANPRAVFLADGLGALLSTLMLGLLALWEPFFGMPQAILYRLMPVAGAFALYSLGCAAAGPRRWRPFLRGIAVANLLYCCATLALVAYHLEKLTPLGLAYFLSEKAVVVALAIFELRLARFKTQTKP
jgi:hypothetical protein